MPTNIEIKARLADPLKTQALVEAISDTPPQTICQRDTFFWVLARPPQASRDWARASRVDLLLATRLSRREAIGL